jgi:hypothetical protein
MHQVQPPLNTTLQSGCFGDVLNLSGFWLAAAPAALNTVSGTVKMTSEATPRTQ